MLNARIEPTFGPGSEMHKKSSTKPGDIRIISVAEYKKQIEAARNGTSLAESLQGDQDDSYDDDEIKDSVWRKLSRPTMWLAFICLNVVLVYFEMQPKTLKPTFYVGTPWGVAEILTPWGADEPGRVAQLGEKKAPVVAKENAKVTENVGFYDNFDK
jgi:hypothetical protein